MYALGKVTTAGTGQSVCVCDFSFLLELVWCWRVSSLCEVKYY